jgi:hypothetical protein
MIRRGRNIRGETAPQSLLNEAKVRSMRAAHRELGIRPIDLGSMFGVDRRCASDVVNMKSWRHVT